MFSCTSARADCAFEIFAEVSNSDRKPIMTTASRATETSSSTSEYPLCA